MSSWEPYGIVCNGYSMVWKSKDGFYLIGYMDLDEFKFQYPLLTEDVGMYEKFSDITPMEYADLSKNAEMIDSARRAIDENKAFFDMLGKNLG